MLRRHGVPMSIGLTRGGLRRFVVGPLAAAMLATCLAVSPVLAVDTDMAISTSAIDFGNVNVGSTASIPVTLTNTGGDPFGPINMFGGAPPSAEFNASQNCQGNTLPAGGTCQVVYEFSPSGTGQFTDTSSFTVSETTSQGDGEDFTVSLSGCGGSCAPPNPTADLSVTISAPSSVKRNGVLVYAIGVANAGPDAAAEVVLTDQIPFGAVFLAVTASGWQCAAPAPKTKVGTVTCTIDPLASGGGVATSLAVQVKALPGRGPIVNAVSVTSSSDDPNPSNNSASVSTIVTK
jgi:uncharacterized repeat protein (TIGR01451 family)